MHVNSKIPIPIIFSAVSYTYTPKYRTSRVIKSEFEIEGRSYLCEQEVGY